MVLRKLCLDPRLRIWTALVSWIIIFGFRLKRWRWASKLKLSIIRRFVAYESYDWETILALSYTWRNLHCKDTSNLELATQPQKKTQLGRKALFFITKLEAQAWKKTQGGNLMADQHFGSWSNTLFFYKSRACLCYLYVGFEVWYSSSVLGS